MMISLEYFELLGIGALYNARAARAIVPTMIRNSSAIRMQKSLKNQEEAAVGVK